MWHLKTTTVLGIVGTLGMIKKETEKYIKNIPGSSCQYEIQKNTLCITAHLLGAVLSLRLKRGSQEHNYIEYV